MKYLLCAIALIIIAIAWWRGRQTEWRKREFTYPEDPEPLTPWWNVSKAIPFEEWYTSVAS